MQNNIRVIAEIGQNHNGNLDNALELIDIAHKAGCYAVKSSKRDIESFPTHWKDKKYHHKNSYGDTYYDHRCALELPIDDWRRMREYANNLGMRFYASYTDVASLNVLCNFINVDALKIASSRVTDINLLKATAQATAKNYLPVHLSTGMSTYDEVYNAANILHPDVLYCCTSSYPCKLHDHNIKKLLALRTIYNKYYTTSNLGYSSHSKSIDAAILAYALGARYFEYHITFDNDAKGTDHVFSLTYLELKSLIDRLSDAKIILGHTWAFLSDSELPTRKKLRDDLQK